MTNVLTKKRIAERMGAEIGYTYLAVQRDAKGVAGLYTKDAVLIQNGVVIATGREQIEELLVKDFSSPGYVPPRVTTLIDDIVIAKDGQSALVPEVFRCGVSYQNGGVVSMTVVSIDREVMIRSESIVDTH